MTLQALVTLERWAGDPDAGERRGDEAKRLLNPLGVVATRTVEPSTPLDPL